MSFAAIAITGGALALGGAAGGMASRASANKAIRESIKNRPELALSDLAKTQLQGRGQGISQMEQNIFQSGANALGKTQQAATSSADLMQAAGGIQSQTNTALANLGIADIQDYQRRYQNFIQEQQYNQAQKMQDWETVNSAQAAIAQNRAKSWGDITQIGMAGLSGGIAGLKPKP